MKLVSPAGRALTNTLTRKLPLMRSLSAQAQAKACVPIVGADRILDVSAILFNVRWNKIAIRMKDILNEKQAGRPFDIIDNTTSFQNNTRHP